MAGADGLNYAAEGACKIEVYGMAGNLVKSLTHPGGALHVDVPQGVYILRIFPQ